MSVAIHDYFDQIISGRPLLLNWASGVIGFYPWFLRIGLVLQRFIQ